MYSAGDFWSIMFYVAYVTLTLYFACNAVRTSLF